MTTSTTSIPTTSASRYLQQLCKHWSHKFTTEFTPEKGHVPFGEERSADFTASDNQLGIELHAPDAATLDKLETVVIDHLKRFSFREDLGEISWTRQ